VHLVGFIIKKIYLHSFRHETEGDFKRRVHIGPRI